MAVSEEPSGFTMTTMQDATYEFSAPRFFDFINGETEEDMHKAELWFEDALPYAPSPFMPKIKADRSIKLANLCDFSEAEKMQEAMSSEAESTSEKSRKQPLKEEAKFNDAKEVEAAASVHEGSSEAKKEELPCTKDSTSVPHEEACTPNPPLTSRNGVVKTNSKKHVTAKNIADLVTNSSAIKTKLQSSQTTRTPNPLNVVKSRAPSPHIHQENQAIKKQKLDGGKSRQILNVQPQSLPHKSKLGLTNAISSATGKTKEERKVYVREAAAAPFVSMAEMMRKFQSSTRDLPLPQINSSLSHMKPKLTLTRPKEPEFETAQRARPVKIKSTAELEEEMLAKIPKFKARPLNKKILQAPTLPAVPRSIPKLPEFQEFHLETMARAHQNSETVSVASTEVSRKDNHWKPILTEPKTPVLQTSLRARPVKVKSSSELEQEELEKMPKFKAKPLNKKIFESKGELGLFCNGKKHITVPQEFHFATNERIPPPATVAYLFDKLSLNPEPQADHPIPRNTNPKPFHLLTEERGAEKEKKFIMEVTLKHLEEERARIPKANPYPYTTDYPVIPPKPEPKHCTGPEPFPLESLVRHEEERQREMEDRQRKEREEAKMRIFKAQPILKEDPIPVPVKVRKPLTEVQEFNLHVDHRAEDRAQFDQRIKEKEVMYKRYREESEAAEKMEEEKALKQLRRTLVSHARPVPNFNHPFCPQKSNKETTKAKSPYLRVKRRERRKTVNVLAAVSSAAANMR